VTGPLRWRRALFVPTTTAVAVGVAALVVITGHDGGPTVARVARPALQRATMSAPRTEPGNHARLALRVADVRFPAYLSTLGWVATGARRDHIARRTVTTVFYRAQDGTRIGYAVVSGAALPVPAGAATTVAGVQYTFGSVESATLVSWRLDGHTCLIVGRRTGEGTLLDLATAGRSPSR
jgi:hypothetical protein